MYFWIQSPDKGYSATAKVSYLLVTTDGKTGNVALVTVTDAYGNPLSGQTITWRADKSTVTFGQSAATDQRGMTTVAYTDPLALTASLANSSSPTASSQFTIDLESAVMTATSTTDALADGSATDTATVTLKDNRGNALPGQAVILSGSAKLSATSGMTDNSGQIQVTLTDTTAETVTITAALSNGKTATAQGAILIYTVTSLMTSSASAKANGSADVTLTATVSNNNGKFVSNVLVVFSVTGSAILSATTVNTNANGQVQVTLTDTTGETMNPQPSFTS